MVNDAAFMNLHFRDLRHDLVYLLFGRRTMSFLEIGSITGTSHTIC
mgnify:CR=1 FL=1